jgi:hypothetical protein
MLNDGLRNWQRERMARRKAHEDANDRWQAEHASEIADLLAAEAAAAALSALAGRRARGAKRRAAERQRTPKWADLVAIRTVYERARRREVETNIPHHVDHIIPLQGEFVSGLHVANNLQVLPGTENIRKRNRFEVT